MLAAEQLKQVNSVHQLSSGLVVEEDRILNGFRSTSGRHARRHANALGVFSLRSHSEHFT